MRGDDHQQFALLTVDGVVAEERAQNRDIAQPRKFVHLGIVAGADQAADDEAFAVGQGDAGVGTAYGQRRNYRAGDAHGVGEVQFTDFRRHLQGDTVFLDDGWRQSQADTELLVLDGDVIAARTGHRNRYFTAGQEARTLPAER